MRKNALIRLCLLLFLLPLQLPFVCRAGEPDPFFRRYVSNVRPSEYGGESQIWSLENDEKGFLYMAAGTGLVVYDGYGYAAYPIDGHSVLRNLFYDAATGRLYCAGDNFFGYWIMDAYGRMQFTGLYANRDFSRNEIFWRIFPMADALYMQTHEAVYVYDSDGLEVLATGDVGYLFRTDDGLYVQLDDRLWTVKNRRLECISEPLGDRIVLLERDRDGRHFVAVGETTGFMRLESDPEIRFYHRNELFPETNRLLSRLKIFSALRHHSGGWMVGTVLDGAYLIHSDGTIAESFNSHSGLDYTTVLSLEEDASGNMTLGADGGLASIRNAGAEKFYYTLSRKIGYVYAATLWNGDLYVGTNKGLFRVAADSADAEPEMIAGSQGQIWDLRRCGRELVVIADRGLCALDPTGSYRVVWPRAWKLVPVPGRKNVFCASDSKGLVLMEVDAEGRLRPMFRVKNYDNPDNSVLFDKYGYVWVEQLKGSVKRLSFDMDYTEVRECRTYRVGRDPEATVRAFSIDGEVLFTSGKECYGYSPHADSLVLSRYYTELFSSFTTDDLNLYQHGNVFFNYVGNTVDAIVRSGSEKRVCRDLFSSSGIDQLPQRYRRVFSWDERTVACGFSECVGIVGIWDGMNDVCPKVTLYGVRYSRHGRNDITPPLSDEIVLPHGATDLEFRICSAPRASLDYRLDGGDWRQVPDTGPIAVRYLASGLHLLEIRFGSEILLSKNFFVRRPLLFRWWFLLLSAVALGAVLYGGLMLYRMRMRKLSRQYEARQRDLIEKEQVCHQNEILSLELKERDKKLSMLALNDITVNNMLKEILNELDAVTDETNRTRLRPVRKCIERYMRDNGTWNNFEQYFNGIFDGFFDRLLARYPRLTNNDMKICAYVKLGMNTKEIASLMNIEISSAESARYRLRKNMGLTQTDSLTEIISKI